MPADVRRITRRLDALAQAQAARALDAFVQSVAPLFNARWAVSLRGSHARGTATTSSDVDLLVITDDAISPEVLTRARRALRHAAGPSHIRIGTLGDVREKPLDHLLLQSLPHLRFAAGCCTLFATWLETANASVAQLTERELLEVLLADPLRRDDRTVPGTPHFDSIKHGPGGTLLYEIAACFVHSCRVRGRRVPPILGRAMAAGRSAMTLQRIAKDILEREAGVCVDSLLPLKSGWRLEGMPGPSDSRRLQYAAVCAARRRFEDYWQKTETHIRERGDDGGR